MSPTRRLPLLALAGALVATAPAAAAVPVGFYTPAPGSIPKRQGLIMKSHRHPRRLAAARAAARA